MGKNKNKTCCTRSRGMSASAIASGNSAAHVGTHWQRQGRWEFGEHETFVEVWRLGCPFFNTRSFWSLRPPAPAAAWSKTVKIILQQDRGGRTGSGVRDNKHPAQGPQEEKRPNIRQSLCPHPRSTHNTFMLKKPRGPREIGIFSTLGMDGRGWPHG